MDEPIELHQFRTKTTRRMYRRRVIIDNLLIAAFCVVTVLVTVAIVGV